jgi:hypothetical protein
LKLSSSLINIESSDVFFYCRECGRNLNNQISRLEFSFNIHLHGFPYTCVWMPCHLKLSIMYVYIMLHGPSSDTCANIKFHHATTLLERKEPDWFGIFFAAQIPYCFQVVLHCFVFFNFLFSPIQKNALYCCTIYLWTQFS